MSDTHVYRCATCGAPIQQSGSATVVRCPYCDSENRLVAAEVEAAQQKNARFAQAAKEADQMSAGNEARAEAIMQKYQQAHEQAALHGDRAAAEAAVRHFEGYMRLQYAPTIHTYRSWDPDDPQVVSALKQIDDAIDQAVGSIAEGLGVEYRSASERLEE